MRSSLRVRRRGMTLLEVSISTAVVGFLAFAAATVTKLTIDTTSAVVVDDASDGQARRNGDSLEDLLLPASRAQLQGIPSNGTVVETMLDNVNYKELRFRRVVGFLNGALTYQPPAGSAAARLYRAIAADGTGSLVLESGGKTTTLVANVTAATFVKSSSKLTLTLSHGRHDVTTDVHRFVLRVP